MAAGRAQAKGGRGSGTVVLVQPAGACRHSRDTTSTGARDGECGDPGGRRQQNERHWQLHLGGQRILRHMIEIVRLRCCAAAAAALSVRQCSSCIVRLCFRHAKMTQDTAFSFLAYEYRMLPVGIGSWLQQARLTLVPASHHVNFISSIRRRPPRRSAEDTPLVPSRRV